jgi:hypothetical protein
LTVLAALASAGIEYYSRRLREGTSEVRFPAYDAGGASAEYIGKRQL